MTDKLQKLTDQIYKEGVERAKQEAVQILGEAQEEKKKILRAARQEAEETKQLAHKEAQVLRQTAESEIRMASQQALSLTRQKLAELVTAKVAGRSAKEVFEDAGFLKKIIEMVIRAWDPKAGAGQNLFIRLAEKDRKLAEEFLLHEAKQELRKGIKVEFEEHIQSGFTLSPEDGSYRLGFTDKDFEELIVTFLRPRIKEFLFGGKP